MSEWNLARKKPVVVNYREVTKNEQIHTREGILTAIAGIHFIIRGVEGEEYPIEKEIFEKTYDRIYTCTACGKEDIHHPSTVLIIRPQGTTFCCSGTCFYHWSRQEYSL